MSDRTFVEKPFLDQLAALDWKVIGVPTDPTKSLRTSFREVILEGVFRDSLHAINRAEQVLPWLTDKQIRDLMEGVEERTSRSPWRRVEGRVH